MASRSPNVIAILYPGAMGSALASLITSQSASESSLIPEILTDLSARSPSSRDRASKAKMADASLKEIAERAEWVLSVLPPSEAAALAERWVKEVEGKDLGRRVFVDCNAVNPTTVQGIHKILQSSSSGKDIAFIDACIIGGPPSAGYKPRIYASVDASDEEEGSGGLLQEFERLGEEWWGKDVVIGMKGAGIGGESALKMSYAGISKGVTGLLTTMILGEPFILTMEHSNPMTYVD